MQLSLFDAGSYGSKFLPFEQAHALVISFGLKRQKEWRKFVKSKQFPRLRLPASPDSVNDYKPFWNGYQHWLTGKSPKEFLPFGEARALARAYSFEHGVDYRTRYTSIPGLPSEPFNTYKDEWQGWPDFLGCKAHSYQRTELFPSFESARGLARGLGIPGQSAWRDFTKTTKFELLNLPADPAQVYRKSWKDWNDFLGTTPRSPREKMEFSDAREVARKLGLTSSAEWKRFCKTEKGKAMLFLKGIPVAPPTVYKGEWTSWADWLNAEHLSNLKYSQLCPCYSAAKPIARRLCTELSVLSVMQWREMVRTPVFRRWLKMNGVFLPKSPDHFYSEKRHGGWEGWAEWIGRDNMICKKHYKSKGTSFPVDLFIARRPEGFYPSITSKARILELRQDARRKTVETGVKHSIDHIDPVIHPLVCGLHVEANFQIIPLRENIRKGNRFTPYRVSASGEKIAIAL
jgi:hypothetical protein